MAALVSITEVRTLGRLPDAVKLPDSIIQPHLDGANRELERWIGAYNAAVAPQLGRVKEAEACICLAYLMPVINTFYTQGITTLQKEMGDMEYLFHTPTEAKALSDMWMERARMAVQADINANAVKSVIGWYAI
jgi:hypothetical protein